MPVRVRLWAARTPKRMAVNLKPPPPLLPIAGIRLGCTRAIQSKPRDDLTAIAIAPGAAVAGVFTRNRYAAPPVLVCRKHLQKNYGNHIRGLLINAGIANAGTLGRGLRDANAACKMFAEILTKQNKTATCNSGGILPFSTGVIMEYLPMQKYAAGLLRCAKDLSADNWNRAAHAIMTTDTVAKGVSKKIKTAAGVFTVTGIAKGSGMIHPNMATMLAFVATDAPLPASRLSVWQRQITADTFNAISVDGDTSTNDSFLLIATGKGGDGSAVLRGKSALQIRTALAEVSAQLAEAIVRDGEGATKFVTICVRGGSSKRACLAVAKAVAVSPLVKTALAASDANVGRFLMALGNAKADFDAQQVAVHLGGAPIIKNGGIHPQYNEKRAAAALAADEVVIKIKLGNSKHAAIFKTCDLTHGYISINADYRS